MFPHVQSDPCLLVKLLDKRAKIVLVTPYWLSQPWFAVIMNLVVAVPRLLLPSPDLLTFSSGATLWFGTTQSA